MVEARWKEAHLQKVVKSLPMLDYLKLSQTARLMFYPLSTSSSHFLS